MAKKITFRDLLVKITTILSSDLYLINNQYIIGGPKSNDNNIGYFVFKLNPDIINVCNETNFLDASESYYFADAKAAKDDLENNCCKLTKPSQITWSKKMLSTVMDIVDNIETWNKFNFTDKEIDALFDENCTIDLFADSTEISTVTVSKTLFPLTNEKNISDLYYTVDKHEDFNNLILSLDYSMFQLYMLYRYIDVD